MRAVVHLRPPNAASTLGHVSADDVTKAAMHAWRRERRLAPQVWCFLPRTKCKFVSDQCDSRWQRARPSEEALEAASAHRDLQQAQIQVPGIPLSSIKSTRSPSALMAALQQHHFAHMVQRAQGSLAPQGASRWSGCGSLIAGSGVRLITAPKHMKLRRRQAATPPRAAGDAERPGEGDDLRGQVGRGVSALCTNLKARESRQSRLIQVMGQGTQALPLPPQSGPAGSALRCPLPPQNRDNDGGASPRAPHKLGRRACTF